jgi:pyruvate ferredoxin oxidoreductase beta subunit/2-oxoisovalerate ferredoxin oxidoreductase beta subunit
MRLSLPEEELMTPGHLACQGCGATLAMRYALKALGPKTILIIPACCWSVIDGPFPYSSLKVPLFHTAFETAASAAAGIKAGLEQLGDSETTVVGWAGDGGTFDIGIQALSGAAERNDDIIYICYDNEAYMNTGIQRSSATPWGAWTTTTPARHPKETPKKNMVEILAAHRIPYCATASVAYPEDMVRKLKKAKEIKGCKFIHVLAPCPTGWRSPPEICVKLARLAVRTKIFPLYEVTNGIEYKINIRPAEPMPVAEYLKLQGRFRHLTDDQIAQIQRTVDWEWEQLERKVKASAEG